MNRAPARSNTRPRSSRMPLVVSSSSLVAKLPSVTITAGAMSSDLLGEVRPARVDLVRGRVTVVGRAALDDVGDVALGPGEADLLPHETVEQLARAPDEGLSGQVFLSTRSLPHEEEVGGRIAHAEDDLCAPLGQWAPGAGRRGAAQPLQHVGVRHRMRRAG